MAHSDPGHSRHISDNLDVFHQVQDVQEVNPMTHLQSVPEAKFYVKCTQKKKLHFPTKHSYLKCAERGNLQHLS